MAEYCMKCMMPMGDGRTCPHCGYDGDHVTAPHRLQPGTILRDRYLVGTAIGQGGFGITYMGRDLTLNIRVAIKEYYPNGYTNRNAAVSSEITISDKEQADFIDNGKKKFLSEARALAQFHENQGVVEVRDFFEENQTAYIVMEYLDGEDLRMALKKNLFTADKIFELMRPVMNALEKVHEVGIVHRDISPDNIMLLKDGRVKLMDFGAARLLDLSDQKSVSVVLKAGYAPEEQYRPKGKQGPWTDIYALCATIYKCITGITPDDALERTHKDELQWPSELGVAISAVQEAVLKKGMAVNQKDRFQNIQEMKAMLDKKSKVQAVEFDDDDDEATVYLVNRGKKPETKTGEDSGSTDSGMPDNESTDSGTPDNESTDGGKNDIGKTDVGEPDIRKTGIGKIDVEEPDIGKTGIGTADTRKKNGFSPVVGVGLAVAAAAVIGGMSMLGGKNESPVDTTQAAKSPEAVETTLSAESSPYGESNAGEGGGSAAETEDAAAEFKNSDFVHIVLNAHEDISVKGYNAALEILKERLNIFAGDEPYYMNAEAHAVDLYLPEKSFGGYDVSNVLRGYLTRPMELYAYDGSGTVGYNPAKIAIGQDDMESVELLHGSIEGINAADYGVDKEEYPYVKLVLTDKCVEKYGRELGVDNDAIVFALDMSFDNYFYYNTISSGDGKTFYLLNVNMEGPFIDLMMYNLTHDRLEEGFTFWVDHAHKADWETLETENMAGENQCNEADLVGDTVTVLYTGAAAEWSQGELIDVELAFKERLDALEQPYAFGWAENDGKLVVAVKTGTDHMGEPVLTGLKEQFGVELRSGLVEHTIYQHSSSTLTTEKKDDGTYQAVLQINAHNAEEMIAALKEQQSGANGEIILTIENQPFLSASIDQTADGTSLVFDRTYLPEMGAITEENLWIVEFVEAVLCGTNLPMSFSYDQSTSALFPGDFTDDDTLGFGVSYHSLIEEIRENIEDELGMEPIVQVGGNTLKVQVDLSVDETLPELALNVSKSIYEICNFENGPFTELIVYPIRENDEERERLRVIFKKNYSSAESDRYSYAHGIFANGRLERYEELFKELVESDEFYREKAEAYPYGGELWRFD